jgi:hypothetical protein
MDLLVERDASRAVEREIRNERSSQRPSGPTLRMAIRSAHEVVIVRIPLWRHNHVRPSQWQTAQKRIGEFKNGRGEFFDQEALNGRTILVRNVWSDITRMSCRFEQAFSDDGGKTWEVNWIAVDTRAKDEPEQAASAAPRRLSTRSGI